MWTPPFCVCEGLGIGWSQETERTMGKYVGKWVGNRRLGYLQWEEVRKRKEKDQERREGNKEPVLVKCPQFARIFTYIF